MFSDRKKLPAFHERELDEILQTFDLLNLMEKGELLCSICDSVITKDIFGCIYLNSNNEIRTACSNPYCLEKVPQEMKNESD